MKFAERISTWWRKQFEEKPAWTDKAIVSLTFFIFAVGVAQTIIFREQWKEMHSGGADTHDLAVAAKAQADEARVQAAQAKIQAEEATESASYMKKLSEDTLAQAKATNTLALQARKSAEYAGQLAATSAAELRSAEETAHNDQRAWLGINTSQLSVYKVGAPIKVVITMSNTGKSPALNLVYSAHVEVLELGESPTFASDYVPPALTALPGGPISIAPVAPQGSYQINVEDPKLLTEYVKDSIDRHSRMVWAWGTVRYVDIFGALHTSEFCAETLHLTAAADAPSQGMLLSTCQNTHNQMN